MVWLLVGWNKSNIELDISHVFQCGHEVNVVLGDSTKSALKHLIRSVALSLCQLY